jgi:hypothetical protein
VLISAIIRSALIPSKQHLTAIFLDLIWRSVWAVLSTVLVFAFGFGLFAQLSSIQWQGPDLGASNPIIVLAALRQFWETYGAYLVAAFSLLLLAMVVSWLILEALFRGGRKAFWLYLGTGAARTTILTGTAAILAMLSTRDESGGTLFISGVVLTGIWFLVAWAETVVRTDSVELFSTDFLTLWAVIGVLWLAEAAPAVLLWGSAAAALLGAGNSSELLITALLAGAVLSFWFVVHSYLIAARYRAIDIMRKHVVRS